ncbi:MAG: ABC transporter ATP-binding protein [Desulfobacterales bacterium]|nr:ABC transporter ATP-binding protein [Desulfobacterales bacterium]MDX2513243.1 ABC transporter ATP-binding protein [Desulfobacterales bacterium]
MTFFKTENISIDFGGIRAVNDVSFEVDEGTIFTIVGPNGAGKTTIFNIISRIYNLTEGRITFKDKDITRLPAHQVVRLGIARTFQNIELFDHATVLHNLLIGRHIHCRSTFFSDLLFSPSVRRMEMEHRRKVEDVIDFLDLQHYRDQLIQNLPYGVRKVVELGRALCTEPKLLLLDEPASGLNVDETEDMSFWIDDIKKLLGITVIMVEHNMNLVSQVSDQVLAINYGEVLAAGSPGEVRANPDVIKAYLGEDKDV